VYTKQRRIKVSSNIIENWIEKWSQKTNNMSSFFWAYAFLEKFIRSHMICCTS
jgi:hypothetical protein